MSPLWQFVILLATHWFGDFILQTRWQAENKSKRLDALTRHVVNYSAFLAVVSALLFGYNDKTGLFAFANGVLHFGTDYCTSRWTSYLYKRALVHKDYYGFWAVIGFDQLIHQVTLAATLLVFIGVK